MEAKQTEEEEEKFLSLLIGSLLEKHSMKHIRRWIGVCVNFPLFLSREFIFAFFN